jgi:glutathione S-transferase
MAIMKLYNADLSPFTTRLRMQIRAKGLETEIELAARPEGDAFKAISATGKVPCLDTGAGFHLPESETIAEFIEDSWPEPSMRGHTALSKAKVRLMSRFVDLYLMPGFSILFGQMNPKDRDEAKVKEGTEKVTAALGLIASHIEGPLYAIDRRLTLADCALVPGLFFATNVGMAFGAGLNTAPAAQAYYDRIITDDEQAKRAVEEMGVALAAFSRRG